MASAAAAVTVAGLAACSSSSNSPTQATGKQTITVAVVNNPQMIDIQKLTPKGFEASHPNIKVKYVTLDENTLRDQVTKDVAASGGQFDVVMIGPYETPIWAKNHWIDDLTPYASKDTAYNVSDLIKPIKDSLSVNGHLYASPFYGESSFLMYRKDLLAKAGLSMSAHPTWDQVAAIAKKLKNPAKGMAGICLRGKTGWGENLAPLDTVVNTMGGQWFDMNWNAHLTSPAFEKATNFYVNLIKAAGESGAGNFSFNECANAMEQQKAAMWYDATVGASVIDDPKQSPIAGKLGFAPAPTDMTPRQRQPSRRQPATVCGCAVRQRPRVRGSWHQGLPGDHGGHRRAGNRGAGAEQGTGLRPTGRAEPQVSRPGDRNDVASSRR